MEENVNEDCSQDFTKLSYPILFIKNMNFLRLPEWCFRFSGEFMVFFKQLQNKQILYHSNNSLTGNEQSSY